MSNFQTTANVVLSVNGKQAERVLSGLERDAEKLQKRIEKAAAAGDKVTMRKLQRELNSTKRVMDQITGSSSNVENVLRRLDKASPKELNKTLKTLQTQLNGIQRGTAAWDAQAAKIKAVKAELQKVNATLATQQSRWQRLNNWLNNCQTAILGATAALTGLIMAARKAVSAYADMEEQLANTQKYTRMTREEVLQLNEIFKSMDTRLPREQLNLLAQEGGRLGYNTVETVKQYVEAASVINVALVDLGEGATQTIAKLTNIFGVEEMYGVKEAMLKVGSTVNHLSQNCTAAKPFLVEFAQRMAGIGSTAKMTIPEIMAFAATLDAHGQKVEMSATALQRTIMALYKDTAGMAKKVGLDARQLTETLNKSTTEGVMMFLGALQKLGEDNALAVLSPLFQDLGLDGARVSSVLSNLSAHLDFLKWQMGEAAQAFRDGTSATNEYTIFNNTAQASIDKARKRVAELAVELGEQLYPLMKHIYTSSSAFLRVLSKIVKWIIDCRSVLLSVITVIAVYYSWILLTKTAHLLWNSAIKVGIFLQTSLRTALLLSKIAWLAMTGNIKAAAAAFRLFNAVVKTNPFGLLLTAASALFLLIKSFLPKQDEFTTKMKDAVASVKSFNAEVVKEQRELDILFGKLKGSEKGTKEYKDAKNAIITQYGKYLSGLIDERGEIVNLTAAYNRLTQAIKRSNMERGIADAEKEINSTYYQELSDYLNALQLSLESYGASVEEAAKITQQVSTAIAGGQTIPLQTQQRINELSRNQPTKSTNGQPLNAWQARLANSAVWNWGIEAPDPSEVVNQMWSKYETWQQSLGSIEAMRDGVAPLRHMDEDALNLAIQTLESVIKSGESGSALVHMQDQAFEYVEVTVEQAQKLLDDYQNELAYREASASGGADIVAGNPDFNIDNFTPYETERQRRARETQERHNKVKERQEFRAALNSTKGEWERADEQNTSDYSAGLIDYQAYLTRKQEILMKYYTDREEMYKRFGLAEEGEEDEDYLDLLKRKAEQQLTWEQSSARLSINEYKRQQTAEETQLQMDFNTPGNAIYGNEEALQQGLFAIRVKYLEKMRDVYSKTSEEYVNYQTQLTQLQAAEQLRRQKLYVQRIAEWRKQYEYLSAGERLQQELNILEDVYAKELISAEDYEQAKADLRRKYTEQYMPDSAKPKADLSKQMEQDLERLQSLFDQGLISKDDFEAARDRIERNYNGKQLQRVRQLGSQHTNQLLDIYQAWKNFFEKSEQDGANWATRLGALAQSVFSIMTAGLQQFSEMTQASADIEVAKVEKKYDREIELAEGNAYCVKQLEKRKETETARIKNEANRKMFSMQVIQAVAQTATNALNAYGSAAAIPVVGYILAPIAAAMAVAAGMVQVAAIKKQQKAAEAQGYSAGGFTRKGRVDEPVGIVHAGEWVASQRLVNSPQTRPLIDALEYMQRTNSIGSLRAADVSRSITAPMILASQPQMPQVVVNQSTPNVVVEQNSEYVETMRRLSQRLDEPFVTIATVTGDHGINRAQDEYDRLIRNKSPKSRK